MMFTVGQRVMTPQGAGTVQYQRLRQPDCKDAEAVSVFLDTVPGRRRRFYAGTVFVAEAVTPLEPEKTNG